MWVSEFWSLMRDEFGDGQAQAIAGSHVVGSLDNRTATEALDAGIPPRQVWLALVKDMDVPEDRWWGRDVSPR